MSGAGGVRPGGVRGGVVAAGVGTAGVGTAGVMEAAAALGLAHPWLEVCAGAGLFQGGTWTRGRALLSETGSPWHPREPLLFGLGDPDDLALLVAAHPGARRIMLPAGQALGDAPADQGDGWQLRVTGGPLVAGPDTPAGAGWLGEGAPVMAEVDALLDLAMPDAAVRPGDPLGGRWCGIRDERGRLAACAAETLPVAPVGHLSSLATRPDRRGSGLGAALTRFFVAEAIAAGAPLVMLGVNGDNVAADRLYDRLGFERWTLFGRRLPA